MNGQENNRSLASYHPLKKWQILGIIGLYSITGIGLSALVYFFFPYPLSPSHGYIIGGIGALIGAFLGSCCSYWINKKEKEQVNEKYKDESDVEEYKNSKEDDDEDDDDDDDSFWFLTR